MSGRETSVEIEVAQVLEALPVFLDEQVSVAEGVDLKPPTAVSKLHSDLEDRLVIGGGALGLAGGAIAANMILNTEGVSWFLAVVTRVAVATPLGVSLGALLGGGSGWLASKAINSVRSRFG